MKTLKLFSLVILLTSFTCCEEPSAIETVDDDAQTFIPVEKTDTKIVFISRRTENSADWSLFVMNPDGSGQSKLTELTVRCEQVVVSHSGKSVLFVHYTDDYFYELYSINIDGTDRKLIDRATRYCGSPDWSPDDSKILYSKNRNEASDDRDLILYDVESKVTHTLTDAGDNTLGRFSKDNNIAFCHGDYGKYDIYRMDHDGSNQRKIISNAGSPVWSPDGQKIAFTSRIISNAPQIFVASLDGGDVTQLTTKWLRAWDSGYPNLGNHSPQWTPDGKKIVYVSEVHDGMPEIYVMNADGSGQTRLTDSDRRNENPAVSGDGKYIYFTSNRDLTYSADVFLMGIDGEGQRPLTRFAGDDIYPVVVAVE